MIDFFTRLLDTSEIPARWKCGTWSEGHGWMHILSDLGIWSAYMVIPCTLGYFLTRRPELPFRRIFLLFGIFILACGATHLMEAIIFWWPAYRLAGGIKLFTALVSWTTAIALIPVIPAALRMRSSEELEREIKERKQAEQALRESEERLQLAVFATDLGIFEHEHATDATYWSPTMREIIGWSSEEPASLPAYIELIHPEQRADEVAAIRQAHDPAGDGLYSVEHQIIRRAGSARWVRICSRTFFEGVGNLRRPVRTIGTMADTTEKKRAEEARGRLAAIVDSAEDAIISKTMQGMITSWNAGAERLLGYSAPEIIGKHNSLIIPVERHEEEPRFLARIMLGETVEHQETVRLHKSGRRVDVALSLSPVRDSAGAVVGCAKIMHDISARKLLEKEVLEIAAREQRRIGQELHDNTGQELTALSLLAETLATKLNGGCPTQVTIITKIVAGLQRTLAQVRAISRGLIPVEVDARGLQAALEELATRTSSLTGADCTMECGRRAVEVQDNSTATHLFHIAQEAITNALRHGKASQITLSLIEDDQTVMLRIQNNGMGFPTQIAAGDGMGLKIMHYRAGLINGRLTVGSVGSAGTVVTCTLFKGTIHEHTHHQHEQTDRQGYDCR